MSSLSKNPKAENLSKHHQTAPSLPFVDLTNSTEKFSLQPTNPKPTAEKIVQLPLPLSLPIQPHQPPFLITPAHASAYELLAEPERWPQGMLNLVGNKGMGKTHAVQSLFGPEIPPLDQAITPTTNSTGWQQLNSNFNNHSNHQGKNHTWCCYFIKPHTPFLEDFFVNHEPNFHTKPTNSRHLLILDNFDQIVTNMSPSFAEWLCYFFNRHLTERAHLLIISHLPLHLYALPDHYPYKDTASRLKLVSMVEFKANNDTELQAALRAQVLGTLLQKQIPIDDEVIETLLLHTERDSALLSLLLEQLCQANLFAGRVITKKWLLQWLDRAA